MGALWLLWERYKVDVGGRGLPWRLPLQRTRKRVLWRRLRQESRLPVRRWNAATAASLPTTSTAAPDPTGATCAIRTAVQYQWDVEYDSGLRTCAERRSAHERYAYNTVAWQPQLLVALA